MADESAPTIKDLTPPPPAVSKASGSPTRSSILLKEANQRALESSPMAQRIKTREMKTTQTLIDAQYELLKAKTLVEQDDRGNKVTMRDVIKQAKMWAKEHPSKKAPFGLDQEGMEEALMKKAGKFLDIPNLSARMGPARKTA